MDFTNLGKLRLHKSGFCWQVGCYTDFGDGLTVIFIFTRETLQMTLLVVQKKV